MRHIKPIVQVALGMLAVVVPTLLHSSSVPGAAAQQQPVLLSVSDVATGLPSALGEVGDQVNMRVAASNTAPLAGIEFELRFDPSVVAVPPGGVQQGEAPPGFFFISNTDNAVGFVKIVLAGAQPSGIANMNIADIAFDLVGQRSSSTDLDFAEVVTVDGGDPPNEVEVVTTGGVINIVSLRCNGLPATIVGTPGDDDLVGTPDRDVIVGLGGDDLIRGRGGHDTICAGGGNDTVLAGDGNDFVSGGLGHDWIRGGAGNDVVYGKLGHDTIGGGRGHDRLHGNRGDDLLIGGVGPDKLFGGLGDDGLFGRAGRDRLFCGPGIDYADGGRHLDVAAPNCEARVNVLSPE